jgi:hypothetical protein
MLFPASWFDPRSCTRDGRTNSPTPIPVLVSPAARFSEAVCRQSRQWVEPRHTRRCAAQYRTIVVSFDKVTRAIRHATHYSRDLGQTLRRSVGAIACSTALSRRGWAVNKNLQRRGRQSSGRAAVSSESFPKRVAGCAPERETLKGCAVPLKKSHLSPSVVGPSV